MQLRQLCSAKAQARQSRIEVQGHGQALVMARGITGQGRQLMGPGEHRGQAVRSKIFGGQPGQAIEHQDTQPRRPRIRRQTGSHGQRLVHGRHPEIAAAPLPQLRDDVRNSQAVGIVLDHSADTAARADAAHDLPVVLQRAKVYAQARPIMRGKLQAHGYLPFTVVTRRRLPAAMPTAVPHHPCISRACCCSSSPLSSSTHTSASGRSETACSCGSRASR